MNRLAIITLFSLAALAVAGCANTLETGYQPRSLNSSSAVRRGYYASPFTPEAKAAQLERDEEIDSRRPKPGY